MAYKQRWLGWYEVLDANGDGVISSDDAVEGAKRFARAFYVDPIFAEEIVRAFLDAFIKEADTSKDGKITKEEFLAFVDKIVAGGPNFSLDRWKSCISVIFDLLDFNKSGDIDLVEFMFAVQRLTPRVSNESFVNAYKWALNFAKREKFDKTACLKVVLHWGTYDGPTPEAEVLLPFLRKNSALTKKSPVPSAKTTTNNKLSAKL